MGREILGAMSEVSCRAFSFFAAAEKAGVCKIDDLIAGLPVSRATLEDPNQRVPWDTWSVICDRFGELFPDDEALLATGHFALTEGFAGQLGRVAGLFVDPVRLYQVAIRWAAPGLYRSVAFSLEKTATGFIVDARLMPGYRPSRAWMVMFEGGLSQLPGFVGEPPTETRRISLDSTHTRIEVPATRMRAVGGVQRALMAVRSPAAIADELTAQQEQLTRSWAEMRRASASFGNVLGALPVAVIVHTAGTAMYVNPAFAALAGAHPVELTGKTLATFFGDAGHAALAALAAVGPGATKDVSLCDSHGGVHHLRTGVVTGLEYDGRQVELVFGTDVTAERSGRERLARSEETLRALMETQPDMVVRLGRDLTILDVIPGHGIDEASVLLGLVGTGVNDLLQQVPQAIRGDVLEMVTQVRDAFERLEPVERAFTVPAFGSGKLRALRVRVTPILAGAEAIVVVRNETARIETEQRLALAERMASVGTLAAGVAHEINNPLTFVTLGTALLRSELAGLPDAQVAQFEETLANLDEGHRRIRDTVSRLQVLTRAERGSGVGVVVSSAIESAVAMTAHETRHRADVHVDVTARQKVNIGPTELGQILINLIVNAAHAIDSSHPELPHRITVSAHDDGPNVVFAVKDTGLGIAAEQLPSSSIRSSPPRPPKPARALASPSSSASWPTPVAPSTSPATSPATAAATAAAPRFGCPCRRWSRVSSSPSRRWLRRCPRARCHRQCRRPRRRRRPSRAVARA